MAWQFFADSDRHALISVLMSYCRFDVEIHAEGHHFHAGFVGGVVRYRDFVAKIKIAKFSSWRVGDSRKFLAIRYCIITNWLGVEKLHFL